MKDINWNSDSLYTHKGVKIVSYRLGDSVSITHVTDANGDTHTVFTKTGCSVYSGASGSSAHSYRTRSFIEDRAQDDHALANELRAIDKRYNIVFKTLIERGYIITDEFGNKLESLTITRIYKEQDL